MGSRSSSDALLWFVSLEKQWTFICDIKSVSCRAENNQSLSSKVLKLITPFPTVCISVAEDYGSAFHMLFSCCSGWTESLSGTAMSFPSNQKTP